MIENYLSFELWKQLLIGGLFVNGVAFLIWGITIAVLTHKKNKNQSKEG
ncbi:hypothetical protein LCGC14_1928110 [marine sediment metagenome]|uniref:Uncharacterized protein n=1 Tax=marine sediment metagenome TaxID=412755 RepID=A0A0F9I2N5_9ZZZZ